MKTIFHLSDWHSLHDLFVKHLDWEIRQQKLEQPDLVVLTGDMLANFRPRLHDFGGFEEGMQRPHWERMIDYIDFVWPGVDIFAVRGNHDWCDYEISGSVKAFDKLEGQTYEWCGYKIHGFRGVAYWMGNWKDEYVEDRLKLICDLVPQDTDILITHGAPNGILDDTRDQTCVIHGEPLPCHHTHLYDPDARANPIPPRNIGSYSVRELIEKLPNLKLHLFGHIHEQGGNVQVRNLMGKDTIFSNAAGTLNKIVLRD